MWTSLFDVQHKLICKPVHKTRTISSSIVELTLLVAECKNKGRGHESFRMISQSISQLDKGQSPLDNMKALMP